LVGYSQGAALALQAGVSFNKPLGGIVALMNWAWLPPVMGRNPSNDKTQIYTILGARDQTIKLHDAKSRMNNQFWRSNRRKNVRLQVLKHHGHKCGHGIMEMVNNWINHQIKHRKN